MIRFVTIVTDDFWPGFAVLLQSLEENSALGPDGFQMVVLCDVDRAPRSWLAGWGDSVELVSMEVLPRIELLSPQNQGERMEGALQKLGLFALPEEWGRCVFIDSDMVCLGDLRPLRGMVPLTAACDELCGLGWETEVSDVCTPEINTGLMVFEPSRTVFEELRSVYIRRHGERTHKGDQDVINMWLQETGWPVHRLGSEWNFSKRFQDSTGRRWIKERIGNVKILHFVGAKPWTNNAEINTFRECHYRWMEEIWWDYFERSGFAGQMDKAPRRSLAWMRAWVLPWSKPAIMKEHFIRGRRLIRRTMWASR